MKRYWAYFLYIVTHKYWVIYGCWQAGVPVLRGLIHDASKFQPCEFFPYARNFFEADGTRRQVRDKTGAYDPNAQPNEFKAAWAHHQKNKHHWQCWVSVGDCGKLDPVPMPEKYVREMVADWIGAGIAISGRKDPKPWWTANRDKMILHSDTKLRIERVLEEL